MSKGLIHVYTGDGKGKTTAAIGLAMRATGQGKKVLILQFLKSRIRYSGEIITAKKSGIRVIKFRNQTTPLLDPKVKLSQLKSSIKRSITRTIQEIKSNAYDLVILDELNTVLSCSLATIKDIDKIIDAKPERLEIIFTGRGAPKKLIEIADYVTEMRMVKHPFKKGVKARKGTNMGQTEGFKGSRGQACLLYES
jgi:cob(I)alamin adenosyltransferase